MKELEWIYGIWFVPGDDKDWMGKLGRADGKWELRYRFRYYAKEDRGDPFSGDDQKSGYVASTKDDSAESFEKMMAVMRLLVPNVEREYGHSHDFVLLECEPSDPKMLFELGSRPWAHIKREPAKHES